MKKEGVLNIYTKTTIIFLMLFFVVNFTHAQNAFKQVFAGRILNTKAQSIQKLEAQGYTCAVLGSTIQIQPTKKSTMPSEYFIPALTMSKTGTTATSGQLIMGMYSGKTTITCERIEPPSIETVNLDTITLWGTSRK